MGFIRLFVIGILFSGIFSQIFSIDQEKIWYFEKLTLRENPDNKPKSIQREFIPEGGSLLFSSEFKGSFGDSIEAVIAFHHSLDFKTLNSFYELIFKSLEWKILQREIHEKNSIFLAEGPSRRMITVLIADETSKRKVKIFLKKATLF